MRPRKQLVSCALPQPSRGQGFGEQRSFTHTTARGPHLLGKVECFTTTNPAQSEISCSVPPPRARTLPKSQGQILAQPHKHSYTRPRHKWRCRHTPPQPSSFTHTINPETRAGKAEPVPCKPPTPQPRFSDATPRPCHALRTRTPAAAPSSTSARAHAHTHTHSRLRKSRTHTPCGQIRAANAPDCSSRTPKRGHHTDQDISPRPTAPALARDPGYTPVPQPRAVPGAGAATHRSRSRHGRGARPYRARPAGRRSAR